MLGLHQELLNEDIVVAEGLLGFALHQLDRRCLTSSGLSQRRMPRPPPPAAAFRMMGKPKLDGLLQRLVGVLQGLGAAGDDGHAALDGNLLGG